MKYFNLSIEFDSEVVNKSISNCLKNKEQGYVCVVDGNVLAHATKDISYQNIINGALVNSCDGSSIAMLAGLIYRQKFQTYTGPEIFKKYIQENYSQYFLGNTEENLKLLENRFAELGYDTKQFRFESLPFKNVVDFDYKAIAAKINEFSPDIIWVSLGAPKQEVFISKLYPLINSGVLFAIGAAFNLFLGDQTNKRAPKIWRNMHMEWIFRVLQEPNRVGKRAINYLALLPGIVLAEMKQLKSTKQNKL